MAITLSEFNQKTKTTAVRLCTGETINISIRLGTLCRKERDRFFAGKDPDRELKEYLAAAIEKWDICLEPGIPAPITPETMDSLPDGVIGLMADAIAKEGNSLGGESAD